MADVAKLLLSVGQKSLVMLLWPWFRDNACPVMAQFLCRKAGASESDVHHLL
jgi:hypothetical protein